MIKKQAGKIEGFFWFVIGIMVCGLAWRFNLGSLREPGSGFVAFISGVVLSILGLVMVLSGIYSAGPGTSGAVPRRAFRIVSLFPFLYTGGVLLGYGLFLETLGYNVTTLLAMWALFYLFYEKGKNRLVLSFLASLATTGVTYLVFEVWLRSQLPRGLFPWW